MKLSIEQALHLGVAAHKEGNLQEAERFYQAILKSQPEHPDANHNLGVLAVTLNNASAAIPLFQCALKGNPKIEQFWISYIAALIAENRINDAKQVIQKAEQQGVSQERLIPLKEQVVAYRPAGNLNSVPFRPQYENQRKQKTHRNNLTLKVPSSEELNTLLAHFQNERYGDAEKMAESLTQKYPSHQFGWKVLGAVYERFGRLSEALVATQKSVQLAPQDFAAHSNLGNILKLLSRLDDSEASYRKAIELKPESPEIHYNLGVTLRAQAKFTQAETSYRKAIDLKHDFAEAHFNLGVTLEDLGRLEDTEVSYRKAIALKPDYAEAHSGLSRILQELGRLDEAESSCNRAIALKPGVAEPYVQLGNTLRELGRLEEAESSYNQSIALNPDLSVGYGNLGNALREMGRLDEAESRYRQAIALKPDYAQAHCNLGATLQELGKLDEAEASCKQAIALEPDLAEAYVNLGKAQREMRRLEEAEASYTHAIELKPDLAVAHSNLGITLFEKGENARALNSFQKSHDLKRRQDGSDDHHQGKPFTMSHSKINHDIEQFEYLTSQSIKKNEFSKLVSEYIKIRDETLWLSETGQTELDPAFHCTLANSKKLLYQGEANRVQQAVNGSLDTDSIYEKYFAHEFGLTFIDDFLDSDAMISLRKFLLESTIWYEQKKGGYLGAYLNDGLASPLILQIASELKSRFPLIIKDHPLNQIWAYKYDSRSVDPNLGISGINIHADFAAVNVNFWVTQSDANLDADTGGMVIYNTEAPKDWSFDTYNNNLSQIQAELSKSNSGRECIPYRENRMVIFNSNLFHETDKYSFKEGYENRRINVTMLFGRREKA